MRAALINFFHVFNEKNCLLGVIILNIAALDTRFDVNERCSNKGLVHKIPNAKNWIFDSP